jgi:hypothetical protein
MLDVMRENKHALQNKPCQFVDVMRRASNTEGNSGLKMLNPDWGSASLIQEWATQKDELHAMAVAINQ